MRGDALNKYCVIAATVLLSACNDCGAELTPIASDAGDYVDAGIVDAGVTIADAGSRDAGADAGAAGADGGQDAGGDAGTNEDPRDCFVDSGGVPFECEGDEDFCDPFGDAPVPQADILAVWSRVEDGVFVLDVRFAAAPFTAGAEQNLYIMLLEDDDPTTDDVAFEPSIEDCTSQQVVVDRWFELDNQLYPNGPPHPYPPRPSDLLTRSADQGGSNVVLLDACTDVDVSGDARTLRLRLRGDFPYEEQRRYLVESTHTYLPGSSRSCEMLNGFAPVSSRDGAPDGLTFGSMCDAACPTGED